MNLLILKYIICKLNVKYAGSARFAGSRPAGGKWLGASTPLVPAPCGCRPLMEYHSAPTLRYIPL